MTPLEAVSVDIGVNGRRVRATVPATETLLEFLRERAGAVEVKQGCGKGDCGTCTVMLDGQAVKSCLVLAAQADGKEVQTVKGLGEGELGRRLQESFVRKGAIQCGFCTPGMIVAAAALLGKNPRPGRQEIREAISGNLCRCTGYKKIVDAIEDAAERGTTASVAGGDGDAGHR